MTTQTKIQNNKPAQKSYNTKVYKKNPKTEAAKKELIYLSQSVKEHRSLRVSKASTPEEAIYWESLGVNDLIIIHYKKQTNAKVFKTFKQWKEEGFKVKKGEKSFRVWSAPLKAKKKMEIENVITKEKETAESNFKFWGMAALFNENQVEKLDQEPAPEQEPAAEKEAATSSEKQPEPTIILEHDGGNIASQYKVIKYSETHYVFYKSDHLCNEADSKEKIIELLSKMLTLHNQPALKVEAEQEEAKEAVIDSPYVMSDYEGQQEARRERLEERTENKRKESDQAFKRSHDLVDHIPMGQPILVGHHSERAHRNALDKSWHALGKSVKLGNYADSLESRAASVGNGGISSNDPEALIKLKEELTNLQKSQETMKAVNKIIRSTKDHDERVSRIVDGGLLNKKLAVEILIPSPHQSVGFASYSLSNNNANIRRIKQRIEGLERLHNSDPIDFENDDFSMTINDGRIVIDFKGGKPNDYTRTIVKRAAFKWSKYQSAWVRKVTANAIHSASRLLEELKQVKNMC